MANLCLAAVEHLRAILLASDGVNAALGAIGARDGVHLPTLSAENIVLQNVSSDLVEENTAVRYPMVYVYCDRMDNRMVEKFTRFSGPLSIVAEVRVSGERFTRLSERIARYVEGLVSVLGDHIGKWTDNLAYAGAYKVQFGPVRMGGQNFVQAARIEIELQGHE